MCDSCDWWRVKCGAVAAACELFNHVDWHPRVTAVGVLVAPCARCSDPLHPDAAVGCLSDSASPLYFPRRLTLLLTGSGPSALQAEPFNRQAVL